MGWVVLSSTLSPAIANDAKQDNIRFEYAFDIGGEPSFAIIQDRDGFLWFSSFFNGLVRYDGTAVKKFREGPDSVSSDFVTQLLEDSDGDIWVGTNFGLNRYDKNTNTFLRFLKDPENPASTLASSTFNLSSNTIVEDKEGFLWFGTQSGLSRFDRTSETFKNFWHDPKDSDSLSDNDIFTVFEDSDGVIWVGTKHHGLNRFDKKTETFTRYRHDPNDPSSLPDDAIQSVIEDRLGHLWLGTRDHGLVRMDRKTGAFRHFKHEPGNPNSIPQMSIWDLYLMRDGRIAVIQSTSAVGLILWDPKSNTYEQHLSDPSKAFGLSTNTVQDVFEDSHGILWVVHNNGKVDKFDPKAYRFNLYKHNKLDPHSLASDAAVPIYEDRRGTIWIGHFGAGLDRYNPKTDDFSHFKPDSKDPTTLPHGYPAGFYEDDRGNFIVSTAGGLVLFDGITGKVIKRLSDDTWFYTMIQDDKDPDVVWAVGWEQSFNRYNWKTGERKVYRHNPNDPTSFAAVTSVRFIGDKDDPNIMWIATWGGGLEKFDKRTETFTHHRHDPKDGMTVSSNTVFDVYEDSKGNFWVATDRGLNKFDKKATTFTRFGRDQGFDAKIVHNILEDRSARLWMGTNMGLVVFDVATEKVVKVYTKEDGLHSHDFFPTARGKTRAGQLWFGGFNGLNSFVPENLTENKVPPQVYLTSIKQEGRELKLDRAFEKITDLHLDWRQNTFEFEYVALNFTNAVKNQYQYFLEGYDKKWFRTGARRFGRYSALPGGTYTLRVRGSNNDGLWNRPDQEVKLTVHVASPPWKTWWAYVAYVLAAAATVFGFYQWRMQASRVYQHRLESDIAARTAELEDAYNVISGSIDYATHIQRSILPHSDSFSTMFDDHFVIWEPRDRVGGDMYWNRRWGDGVLIILADCTGHGVPGAFMSLIASGALDRAQEEVPAGEVGTLVQRMHQLVQLTLGQYSEGGATDDGLELGACYLDADLTRMTFAGARFSLFKFDGTEVEEIKGDKKGIGYRGVSYEQGFTDRVIELCPGLSFYLTSDGFIEQVGGEKRRMFGKKRFKALLVSVDGLPFHEQKRQIAKVFRDYQGDEVRRDDVSVIGFKV